LNRDEKQALVQQLNESFSRAKIAILADYKGLKVAEFEKLRVELKKNNAEIRVAKNTLLRRAVDGTAFEALKDEFKGSTAVAVSYDDPVTPAKALVEFAKDNPQIEIRNAALEGKILSSADLAALAKLPGREVLLAQLMSVMNAVPTNLVQVLSGVPRKFLYLLQAIADQKEN